MTRLWSLHASAFALTLALGCTPATYGESNTSLVAAESGTAESGDTMAEAGSSAEGSCVIGAEGCACTPGGGCDPDLMCEAGVCTGCVIGSEGCPCTAGGGCDGGLMCDAGLCLPGASTGDGDTAGDGDGDPLMCALPQQGCDVADPVLCLCEGCNNNGECWQNEDCVCPDCTQKDYCTGNDDCNHDGACSPYTEGCSCADCADHPLCG